MPCQALNASSPLASWRSGVQAQPTRSEPHSRWGNLSAGLALLPLVQAVHQSRALGQLASSGWLEVLRRKHGVARPGRQGDADSLHRTAP